MQFKNAVVVSKDQIKGQIEGVSLKKSGTYFYSATIKDHSLKRAAEESIPYFEINGEVFFVITEDSYLWQFVNLSKTKDAEDKENDSYTLDDFFSK
jgi:hypothetical protein